MTIFLNVLLIEQEPDEAKRTQDILKKNTLKKMKSIIASSLADALSRMNKKTFDVIILDPELRDSQGIESFRRIHQASPNTPIIIFTELQREAVAIKALAEGAHDYFFKGTFNGHMLIQSIGYSIERMHHAQTQNEYALLIENSNEAIFSLTDKNIIKNWNHAAEGIYKYLAHEIIGKPFLLLVPDENKQDMSLLLKTINSGNNIRHFEITLLDKNKKRIESIINVSPIKNSTGNVIGGIVQAQDVTSQKASTLQSSIQLRIASILAESSTVRNATRGILKVFCESFGFSEGEIWAVDQEIEALRYISNWSITNRPSQLSQVSQGMIFHLNEGLPGYIWANKKPYWSKTLDKEPSSSRKTLLTDMGINSCFGFPIVFEGHVFGICLFYSANIKKFDIGFRIIFEVIGEQIGSFLKHRRMEEELLQLVQHDGLTGLANRLYITNAFDAFISQAKRQQTMLAILYFDLDHFKHINDSLGHHKGDLLLQEIARRVQKSTRDGDLIARFGGDEFAVILFDLTTKTQIDVVAKKILDIVEQPFIFDKKEYYITASMGISIYPDDGDDIETLFKSADLSMYRAKQSGRNNYQYANAKQNKTERDRLLLNTRLHQAIQKCEFILYYQPIVDIQSNKITSMEALIRWKNATGEIISPDNFIPQLEESNLILKTGLWALKTACKQMKKWQTSCVPFQSISVNISVRQLNDQLVPLVKNILNDTGLDPDKLILEITESMLMQQTYIALDILRALKDIGVWIAIDDFGTGYSSFSYLKTFDIQLLKIDKSFISGLHKSESSKSIVTAIILMAHALGLKTIAEGVETKEQLDFLKEKNCDMYQGYYCSKPLPAEELEPMFYPIDG